MSRWSLGQLNMSSSLISHISELLLRFEERLLNRPMVFFFVMCLIGGYLGYYFSICASVTVALTLCVLMLARMLNRKNKLRSVVVLALGITIMSAFVIGFILWVLYSHAMPEREHYVGSVCICSSNCHLDGYKNLILKLSTGEKVIYLTDQRFDYGTELEVECDIELIVSSGNPGDIDIRDFYNRQGILRMANSVQIRSLSTQTCHPIYLGYRLGARISEYLHNYWQKVTNEEVSGFLSAMVIGNDHFLENDVKDLFSKSNLAHLLVVSGAHVGYFSSTVLTIISIFTNKRKNKLLFVMIMLIVYGFLCGWSGSATRSIIMYLLMSGISMVDKASDKLTICSVSAIIMIIFDPFVMFSTGVLLSFGATLSITLFQKSIEKRLESISIHLPQELNCAVSCFICAQFGMLPVLISLGSSYSLINIVVILLAGFPAEAICSMGLMITLISLAMPFSIMKSILFVPINGLIQLLIFLSEFGATETLDRFSLAKMPFLEWITISGIFLTWTVPTGLRRMLVSFVTSFSLLALLLRIPIAYPNECNVYFLNVGQGDCALIIYENMSILIDGGEVGCGEKIRNVMDFLDIDGIDMALMSHLDIDHVGGILELWEMGCISSLYAPFWAESKEMNELRCNYPNLPDEVKIISLGDTIEINSDFNIQCLWPSTPQTGGNEDSLVLLLHVFDVNVVMTGDINEEVEKQLQMPDIQSIQVLKVAHHGSRFSTSEYFLDHHFIDAAVISVGYNHYGHPSQDVMDRLEQFDIPYFRTDKGGCVCLHICDDSWEIQYYFDK